MDPAKPRQVNPLDDEEVLLLLQIVWDLVPERMHWPNYDTVDRLLYREHGVEDVDAIIARIPTDLLRGGRPQGGAGPLGNDQLVLTLPAVATACKGVNAAAAVGLVICAARLAAQVESRPSSDGTAPTVEFADAATEDGTPELVGPQAPVGRRDVLARLSGLLLLNEPWTSSMGLYESGWKAEVNRKARRYTNVQTWPEYNAIRATQMLSGPAPLIVPLNRRWTVGAMLGQGGFGRVYRATAEDDGTDAAIKFVPKAPGADREQLFVNLPNVRNVVPVIDQGEYGNDLVLVMPYAAAGSLDDRITRGPIPIDEAIEVLRDLAAALVDLSTANPAVVHRDIKPGNVLRLGGSWCLADFGISRYAEATTDPFTQKFALSPPYGAPERWNGERATAAVDVYALGVLMHQLIAGQLPFPGPAIDDYREQHLHRAAPILPADVPPRLAALIAQCMAKPAGARPNPYDLQERATRPFQAPQSSAAQALAVVNRQHAEGLAHADAAASAAQSDEQRRTELSRTAESTYEEISGALLDPVREYAPTARIIERSERASERLREHRGRPPRRRVSDAWSAELGGVRFGASTTQRFDVSDWGGRNGSSPPFDVIAYATISVYMTTPDSYGYQGRSHSLYYADPLVKGSYGWYETAFMLSPFAAERRAQAPFAADPGEELVAKALTAVMGWPQLAWPFTRLDPGDIDEFANRWIEWFTRATQGQLNHPHSLPEGPVGSWRRDG